MDKVLFYDENNEPIEFLIEGKFEINEDEYAALTPVEDQDSIYILRIELDENGEEVLVGIDDDELEEATKVYEDLINE